MDIVKIKQCKICGKNFLQKTNKKFCSSECSKKFRTTEEFKSLTKHYRKKQKARDLARKSYETYKLNHPDP